MPCKTANGPARKTHRRLVPKKVLCVEAYLKKQAGCTSESTIPLIKNAGNILDEVRYLKQQQIQKKR